MINWNTSSGKAKSVIVGREVLYDTKNYDTAIIYAIWIKIYSFMNLHYLEFDSNISEMQTHFAFTLESTKEIFHS